MAFGFDDFAKFFDPVSDLLGTSGKQGVGLLQQKPENIAMAAAAAYLAANGIPVNPETLAAAEPLAAAGESAALTTPQVAAMTPQVGIMDPALVESMNAPGVQTAGLFQGIPLTEAGEELPGAPYGYEEPTWFDKLLGRKTGAVRLEPIEPQYTPEDFGFKGINEYTKRPIVEGTSLNPFPGGNENKIFKTMAHTPDEVSGLDWASQSGYEQANIPALQDYQRTQLENELAARSAAAPPSTIQQFENPAATTQNVFRGNPAEMGYEPPVVTKGSYFNNGITGEYTDTLSPFERGMDTAGRYFDKAADWAEKHPYQAAGLAYYGAYKTGMLDQPKQEPIPNTYVNPYSMANFRRSAASPLAYQYRPRYAKGGIASVHNYAKGGRSKADAAMDFYDVLNPQYETPPPTHSDPGIYYDLDPDTRYLDPMEAAMVRMSKLNSRTNVQAPTMTPSRRMGELDFKPVAAARGGIMGYAAGGDVPIEDEEFRRLTSRGGPSRYEDPNPGWTNATNAEKANWAREHPILSIPGQYFTSPASTVGAFLNFINPEKTKEANLIFRGIDPTPNAAGGTGDPTSGRDAVVGDRLGDVSASFSPVQAPGEGGRGIGGIGGNAVGPVGRGEGGQDSNGEHGASLAHGGIAGYNLGGYAAGGNPRLLRGPGDGMSDNIPATINDRQPARLADGEYVVTADVVSHLGNGSTEAGAKQLDAMMKRVRKGRTGTSKQGKQINPRKYLPA